MADLIRDIRRDFPPEIIAIFREKMSL